MSRWLVLALATVVFLAGCSSPAAKPSPTATQVVLAVQIPVSTSTPQPTLTPTPTPGVFQVGNTGGDGVWLRGSPALADRVRAWPDGTLMQVVGPDKTGDDQTFKNVKDPAGNVGFVPAIYLVEAKPTPTPSATPTRPMATPTKAAAPVANPTPAPAPRTCCKICTTGKACGDSCINVNYTCRQPPGCACNG